MLLSLADGALKNVESFPATGAVFHINLDILRISFNIIINQDGTSFYDLRHEANKSPKKMSKKTGNQWSDADVLITVRIYLRKNSGWRLRRIRRSPSSPRRRKGIYRHRSRSLCTYRHQRRTHRCRPCVRPCLLRPSSMWPRTCGSLDR